MSARLNQATYVRKWLVLGALIGIIAGLGAVVFYAALQFCTHIFLGALAGYRPPTPIGDGGYVGSALAHRRLLPVIVGGGGLLSGVLVHYFAPDASGHGTDAAIEAVHHDPWGISPRTVFVKLLASAITIGSGGSAGREGPTGQISAGFGSLIARILRLDQTDAQIAVATGIGAGIGSIFGAPI